MQRYVRDCLRIAGELGITKLQPERIRAMTQSDLPSEKDRQITQLELEQIIQSGKEPPPELVAKLQMPTFEQVLAALRDDLTRSYKIDIETDSTIEAEATEDKQEVTDALTALGQALSSISPLVQQGILPFEAAKTFLLVVARKFKFGVEIEDQINAMQQPAQQPQDGEKAAAGPSPEQMKAEADVALTKAQAEVEKIRLEMEQSRQEHVQKMEELARKAQLDQMNFQRKMAELSMPRPAPVVSQRPATKKGV